MDKSGKQGSRKQHPIGPLKTLHGWNDFLRAHGLYADTVSTFGCAVIGIGSATSSGARTTARGLVTKALGYVGESVRYQCEHAGVPLWPAIVPAKEVA